MIPRQNVIDQIVSLPTMPTTAARIFSLSPGSDIGPDEFEVVIRPDPALTANVLRMANSACFGQGGQVKTVRRAVQLLGTRQVIRLATSALLTRVVPRRLPGYDIEAQAFWQHCLAVALLAERLAAQQSLESPDLIFTAGLLHDIGKLVIGTFLAEGAHGASVGARLQSGATSLAEAERGELGLDHAEIGAELAAYWKLPAEVIWVSRWHHAPGQVPDGVDRTMVDLVHLADGLAHSLGFGADVGELSRQIDPGAVERLGLGVRDLEHVASRTILDIQDWGDALARGTGGTA